MGKGREGRGRRGRLAREEGLFAGTSSGANVVASMKVTDLLGPGAKIVKLMVDS
jgi:cysteine synthase A